MLHGALSGGQRRSATVAGIGTAQTLAWASSYYLPAMLATSMARDLGIGTPTVFLGFSLALAVSALLGPSAGKLIDSTAAGPCWPPTAWCLQRAWPRWLWFVALMRLRSPSAIHSAH